MIYFKEIRSALGAVKFGSWFNYTVIVLWYLLNWRKFRKYAEKLKAGMSWRFAYETAWKY